MTQPQNTTLPRYVQAGPQFEMNMRIGVSHRADLPDADVYSNEDDRRVFKACETAISKIDFRVPVWFAVAVILLTTVLMLSQISNRMLHKAGIEQSFENVKGEIERIEGEIAHLQSNFDKKSDSSYICIEAQKLGMKRAVDESVIMISAPDTRPVQLDRSLITVSAANNGN